MAIGAIAGAVGGLLGGIAGAQGSRNNQTTTSSVRLRDVDKLNRGEGQLATQARESQAGQFGDLEQLLTQGGMDQAVSDITDARQAQLDLVNALRGGAGAPSEQNLAQAQRFANDIFAPQREALSQQFEQSETDTARLAARLGRSVDDPILRAKLAQQQTNQMSQLQAQQGAFTAQQALGFQQRGIDVAGQIANVRGGLASQALQNRQALLGMGQSLLQQERQFRLQQAGRTSTTSGTSGGGAAGAIGGALAGVGAGLGAISKFNSLSGEG